MPPPASSLRLLAAAVLLAATLPLHAQDGRSGTLKTVLGDVTITGAASPRAAVSGGGVAETERLATGPGAAATLTLRDGSALVLGPATAVEVTRFQYDPTTQNGNIVVHLLSGSIRFITGLIARQQPDNVKVRTATAVVGVRGTDFIVEAP